VINLHEWIISAGLLSGIWVWERFYHLEYGVPPRREKWKLFSSNLFRAPGVEK
jgi:hypothetical protein